MRRSYDRLVSAMQIAILVTHRLDIKLTTSSPSACDTKAPRLTATMCTIMEALKGHVKFLKTVCVSPNYDLRIS